MTKNHFGLVRVFIITSVLVIFLGLTVACAGETLQTDTANQNLGAAEIEEANSNSGAGGQTEPDYSSFRDAAYQANASTPTPPPVNVSVEPFEATFQVEYYTGGYLNNGNMQFSFNTREPVPEGLYQAVIELSDGSVIDYQCYTLENVSNRVYCFGPALPEGMQMEITISNCSPLEEAFDFKAIRQVEMAVNGSMEVSNPWQAGQIVAECARLEAGGGPLPPGCTSFRNLYTPVSGCQGAVECAQNCAADLGLVASDSPGLQALFEHEGILAVDMPEHVDLWNFGSSAGVAALFDLQDLLQADVPGHADSSGNALVDGYWELFSHLENHRGNLSGSCIDFLNQGIPSWFPLPESLPGAFPIEPTAFLPTDIAGRAPFASKGYAAFPGLKERLFLEDDSSDGGGLAAFPGLKERLFPSGNSLTLPNSGFAAFPGLKERLFPNTPLSSGSDFLGSQNPLLNDLFDDLVSQMDLPDCLECGGGDPGADTNTYVPQDFGEPFEDMTEEDIIVSDCFQAIKTFRANDLFSIIWGFDKPFVGAWHDEWKFWVEWDHLFYLANKPENELTPDQQAVVEACYQLPTGNILGSLYQEYLDQKEEAYHFEGYAQCIGDFVTMHDLGERYTNPQTASINNTLHIPGYIQFYFNSGQRDMIPESCYDSYEKMQYWNNQQYGLPGGTCQGGGPGGGPLMDCSLALGTISEDWLFDGCSLTTNLDLRIDRWLMEEYQMALNLYNWGYLDEFPAACTDEAFQYWLNFRSDYGHYTPPTCQTCAVVYDCTQNPDLWFCSDQPDSTDPFNQLSLQCADEIRWPTGLDTFAHTANLVSYLTVSAPWLQAELPDSCEAVVSGVAAYSPDFYWGLYQDVIGIWGSTGTAVWGLEDRACSPWAQSLSLQVPNFSLLEEPTSEPGGAGSCVQPPHPDPQNGCWIWNADECQWECIN